MIKSRGNNVVERIDVDPARKEYAALAGTYNARWRRYLEKSTDQTLAALDPKDGEYIVDLGCGTGFLLHRAAKINPSLHLIGVDISRAMLQQARHSVSGRTDLVEADVHSLPFPDRIFDAAVVANVLHYVLDAKHILSEATRVLRPGGRIVVTAWDGDALSSRLRAIWLSRSRHARVYLHRDLPSIVQSVGFRVVGEISYSAGACWQLKTCHAVLMKIPEFTGTAP